MKEEVTLNFTNEEIRLLSSLMMNARYGLIRGLDSNWMPTVVSLSDKFSLAQIRQAAKMLKNKGRIK